MAKKEPKGWITVNGVHVPIFDGDTKESAIKNHMSKVVNKDADTKQKQIADKKKEADDRNTSAINFGEKALDEYEKDGKKVPENVYKRLIELYRKEVKQTDAIKFGESALKQYADKGEKVPENVYKRLVELYRKQRG